MMTKNKLRVSEIFSSLQGEGSTMGLPSVFLRLTGCNLLCGNPQGSIKGKTQEEIYDMQDEDASWTCDTISVWMQGEAYTVEDLITKLKNEYASEFLSGSQLVITGGEPLTQQDLLPDLIKGLRAALSKRIRVEIETNGTVNPSLRLTDNWKSSSVDQFNVSPKLANSGMPKDRRIKDIPMNTFAHGAYENNAIFKFVVTEESDLHEIVNDYLNEYEIPYQKVYLMPGCSNREQYEKVAPLVAELCRKHGYHFSSRLQINLWDKVTGV